MPVRRLIFCTDLHIADSSPLGRKEGYADQILAKIAEIRDIAYGATAVICGGDIFHHKRPNQVSHSLVQRVMAELRGFTCPIYVVPGNHDMGPAELGSMHKQPLGVLERAGVITLLGMEPFQTVTIYDDFNFVARPYSMVGDADPAYYSLTEDELQALSGTKFSNPTIMIAHGSLLPVGAIRPYPHVTIDQVDWREIDLVLAGHIHENLGIHRYVNQTNHHVTWFANPGSIGRTARTTANYVRPVQVTEVIINEDGALQIETVPLKSARPFNEVFDGEDADHTDGPSDEIKRLAEVLAQGLDAEEVTIEELMAEAHASEPVQRILRAVLEEAGL